MGTRYDGLPGFEYKDNHLKKRYQFQTQNGLTDNFITSLATDGDNNIIIGTQTGLDRLIKLKDGSYRVENITKSNNIFSYISIVWTDTYRNAFALTNSGTVFQLEPAQAGKTAFEPQLLIEELKINGKPIPFFQSPLQLQYNESTISFSVAAPAFIDEKQIKYSYLLTGGGNKKWSDTTSIADINLLNLSPGNYTLQVKAFFGSTVYATKEKSFSFTILPPWWQRWWFKFGVGILGLAVLVAVIRFYYRRKLEANLMAYLENAARKGMKAGQYTVNVRFLVEKDGRMSDVIALDDPGFGLGKAAQTVIRTGPRWKPGELNGKKVRSYHTQPITFQISEK